MIGLYLGLFISFVGVIMTFVINRNVEVPMSDSLSDIPIRIKVGILILIFGMLLVCASIMCTLITNPKDLLH